MALELKQLAQCLDLTLDPKQRKQAEVTLQSLEKQPSFAIVLLQLVSSPTVPSHTLHAASIYFKNFVGRCWVPEDGTPSPISEQDKTMVKAQLVDLMISVPQNVQLQLSEAVTKIADFDFPDNWVNLIPTLVSKLAAEDLNVINGVLQTAHSIFKRWRHQFRTTALFLEIKTVLKDFTVPYLQTFQRIDSLIDRFASDATALKSLFTSLLLLLKIFYSLNSQDLPEFFEDNHEVFMNLFIKYLTYNNPLLDTGDDDEVGPLEKVKTAICESIHLYAVRYEEEFTKLPDFVNVVWTLLTNIGRQGKYDMLVSKAIAFLTAVVRPARHVQYFANPETLKSICEKIVLPNVELRETDEELFEDDPIEYIRRDLEGSDADTRRGAASELIRGLLQNFAKEITDIAGGYVQRYLEEYERNRKDNWRAKDTALYLIMALSAKSVVATTGATNVNEYVQILPILTAHVLPELSAGDSNVHSIIKVDAIKYLLMFRSQLTKQQLIEVFPMLLQHLSSTNYVVYTYAAVCIERILAMRPPTNQFQFTSDDIKNHAHDIMAKCFALIWTRGSSPEKVAENDYLMKTIMRVIVIAKADMMPYIKDIIEGLVKLLGVISTNPSNPKFNHYVFEALASVVRYTCMGNPSMLQLSEDLLFGPFQTILNADVTEFVPYVFQILSQLLEYRTGEVPPQYQQLLPPLLQPTLWESSGNVPALVRLLQAYLQKGAGMIADKGQLQPVLGIFQKLIASKVNDTHGFELLKAIFEFMPLDKLLPYIKSIFVLIMNRLMTSKTTKFTKDFLLFFCTLVMFNKQGLDCDAVVGIFETIQQGIFSNIALQIFVPTMPEPMGLNERKLCVVAMTRLLTESQTMLSDSMSNAWTSLLSEIIRLCERPVAETGDLLDEEVLDIEESGFHAAYSRLATVGKQTRNPVAGVADEKAFLASAVVKLQTARPEKFQSLFQGGLAEDLQTKLREYIQAIGA